MAVRNQPKFNFLKNTVYALKGMKDLLKNEVSFKIELLIVFLLLPVIFIIDATLSQKLLMFVVLMGMPLVEAVNSAIERTVDLVTLEYHELAGRAKDAGSAAVFLSIVIFVTVWGVIIYDKL